MIRSNLLVLVIQTIINTISNIKTKILNSIFRVMNNKIFNKTLINVTLDIMD